MWSVDVYVYAIFIHVRVYQCMCFFMHFLCYLGDHATNACHPCLTVDACDVCVVCDRLVHYIAEMQPSELEPWACIRRHIPLNGVVPSVGNCSSVVCTLACIENDIMESSKVLACDGL